MRDMTKHDRLTACRLDFRRFSWIYRQFFWCFRICFTQVQSFMCMISSCSYHFLHQNHQTSDDSCDSCDLDILWCPPVLSHVSAWSPHFEFHISFKMIFKGSLGGPWVMMEVNAQEISVWFAIWDTWWYITILVGMFHGVSQFMRIRHPDLW